MRTLLLILALLSIPVLASADLVSETWTTYCDGTTEKVRAAFVLTLNDPILCRTECAREPLQHRAMHIVLIVEILARLRRSDGQEDADWITRLDVQYLRHPIPHVGASA